MRFSLRDKIISIIVTVIISVLLFAAVHAFWMYREEKDGIRSRSQQIAADISKDLDELIIRSRAILMTLAKHPSVMARNSQECDRLFAELLPHYPMHINIVAADMNGFNYGSGVPAKDVRKLNYQNMEWFQRAREGESVAADRHISRLFEKPSAMIAEPVYFGKRQVGVVGLPFNLDKVREFIAKAWGLPDGSTIDVVDSKGNNLVCIYYQAGKALETENESACLVKTQFLNAKGSEESVGPDGIKRLYSFSGLTQAGWTVIAGVPVDAAYARASDMTIRFVGMILAGAVLAFILGMIFSRNITRRVYALSKGLEAIEQGKLNHQMDLSGDDELSDAARSFNRMAAERRRAEDGLQKTNQFLSSVFESMGEGLVVIDPEFRIISANKEYCRKIGMPMSDIIGKYCYEVSHHRQSPCYEAGEECSSHHTFRTAEPHVAVHTHYDKNGENIYTEVKSYPIKDASGNVTSVVEIMNDITEKRRLEEQLRQAQKLEAVGVLAGGVAHDFNNILSAIIGYTHVALMKMKEDEPLRHELEQVLAASERATTLTQSLLAFSRKQVVNLAPVDVNGLIERFEKFLRKLIREDIELRTRVSKDSLVVMADSGQIEQVLMNLVANARDAMPGGGRLTIETAAVHLSDDFTKAHGYGKPGDYALIAVTDTGVGMDERTREKIFEPFFTTKEQGKGTGLGLAMVYGIVKKHDGFINVYSEPGKGTTFKIYLPLTRSAADETDRTERIQDMPVAGGTETVLVAEDDDALRRLVTTVLRHYGYTVIEAADGMEAIRKFTEHKDAIRLAVLDGIMPKKNGKEVYDELQAAAPGLKVIFMSGYAEGVLTESEMREKGLTFLLKPISPNELARRVREALDRK